VQLKRGAVKGKPPLVEKNPQPLGVILRLEEELGKGKNIVIVLFFVADLLLFGILD
jgi:hypothetical protein